MRAFAFPESDPLGLITEKPGPCEVSRFLLRVANLIVQECLKRSKDNHWRVICMPKNDSSSYSKVMIEDQLVIWEIYPDAVTLCLAEGRDVNSKSVTYFRCLNADDKYVWFGDDRLSSAFVIASHWNQMQCFDKHVHHLTVGVSGHRAKL